MKKLLFSATVGYLVLDILLSCFNLNRAAAQTSSLTAPLKLAQNQTPRINNKFDTDSKRESTLTLAPISPACPFPPLPISSATAESTSGISIGAAQSTSNFVTFVSGDRSDADLGYTVYELVSAKKLDQALQVALKIKDIKRKNETLNQIADADVKAGKLEQALQVAKQITEPQQSDNSSLDKQSSMRDYTLSQIADAYVAAGKLEQALQIAEIMGDTYKVTTLLTIAQKYQEVKQPEPALKFLDEALALYRAEKPIFTNPIEAAFVKMLMLTRFAAQYADLGQKEQVVKLASEIFEQGKTLPKHDFTTLSTLSSTAELYNLAGQQDQANQVLVYAIGAAQNIKETSDRAFSLVYIADEYAKLKQPNRAKELLSQALELAKLEPDVSAKNLILIEGARTYGTLGQYEQAFQVINPVLPRSLRDSVKQTLACSQKKGG